MNSIVPHLNGWTKVVVWLQDFPVFLFGMDSDLGHLPVQFDYHQAQPWWQWILTVLIHIVDRIQALLYAVDFELLQYYCIVPL